MILPHCYKTVLQSQNAVTAYLENARAGQKKNVFFGNAPPKSNARDLKKTEKKHNDLSLM